MLNKKVLVLGLMFLNSVVFAEGRDTISVVGSSTVYPFSTVVAERFGKSTKFSTPKIESTGTGGGMKLFCAGLGVDTPDMSNASRRIKKSELDMCKANGVEEVVEVFVNSFFNRFHCNVGHKLHARTVGQNSFKAVCSNGLPKKYGFIPLTENVIVYKKNCQFVNFVFWKKQYKNVVVFVGPLAAL